MGVKAYRFGTESCGRTVDVRSWDLRTTMKGYIIETKVIGYNEQNIRGLQCRQILNETQRMRRKCPEARLNFTVVEAKEHTTFNEKQRTTREYIAVIEFTKSIYCARD